MDPTQHARYVQTPEGLEITNAQYLDTRMFTCTASNIFGTQEKHVYLVVIGNASDVIMIVYFCCGFYLSCAYTCFASHIVIGAGTGGAQARGLGHDI